MKLIGHNNGLCREGTSPSPTVGHDLFRNQTVGATLVVALVGGHFFIMCLNP